MIAPTPRVLLIEDDPADERLLREHLRQAEGGIDVVSGRELL